MSRATATRAAVIWCAILVLAIANGAARESLLVPRLGRPIGLLVSGVVLCALVLLVSRLSMRWVRPASTSDAWRVGALWVAWTLAFEFAFGALVQHKTWHEMLQPYLLRDANIWPLVLAATLIAPRVWYHRTCERSRDIE
jgi:hypothetical protein